MCESVVEKSPTAALQVWFSLTLMLPGPVRESTCFAWLVDTDNGNDYSGGIDVADGIGYCVGEIISG